MTQITHLKVLRYPEALEGPLRPMHWDVDPSSVCDHRCRGCPYIYDGAKEGKADPMLGVVRLAMAKENRGFLGLTEFVKFVGEAREHGCRAITFVGGGEPTLHPSFDGMCRLVHRSGIKFGIVTHLGGRYDDDELAAMSKAIWIRVSLNAGSATYERHQGRNHFQKALDNMRELSKRGVRIGASFLVTEENRDEIALAALEVQAHGGRFIQYKPLVETRPAHFSRAAIAYIHRELRAAKETAQPGFEVLDQWAARQLELIEHDSGLYSGQCHVPRWNPKLGADGVVYTCCELAYSQEAALGSIYETPLAEILEAARVKKIDQARCPHCWAKPTNTMINNGTLSGVLPAESDDQEFL